VAFHPNQEQVRLPKNLACRRPMQTQVGCGRDNQLASVSMTVANSPEVRERKVFLFTEMQLIPRCGI
jgi:hypothetical protein